jgi:hypothetical protein
MVRSFSKAYQLIATGFIIYLNLVANGTGIIIISLD